MVRILVKSAYEPQTCTCDVEAERCVSELKKEIQLKYPSNPSVLEQRLIYNGRILMDGECMGNIFPHAENSASHVVVLALRMRPATSTTTSCACSNASSFPSSMPAVSFTPTFLQPAFVVPAFPGQLNTLRMRHPATAPESFPATTTNISPAHFPASMGNFAPVPNPAATLSDAPHVVNQIQAQQGQAVNQPQQQQEPQQQQQQQPLQQAAAVPPPWRFDWKKLFQFKLIAKLALFVFLFAHGGNPYQFVILITLAVITYIFRVVTIYYEDQAAAQQAATAALQAQQRQQQQQQQQQQAGENPDHNPNPNPAVAGDHAEGAGAAAAANDQHPEHNPQNPIANPNEEHVQAGGDEAAAEQVAPANPLTVSAGYAVAVWRFVQGFVVSLWDNGPMQGGELPAMPM